MKTTSIKVGDDVWYSPIIGRRHDGKVYTVKSIGTVGGGELVAWLFGKSGCVAIEALALVKDEE